MDGIIHEPITSQQLCSAVSKEVEAYVGFSPQANIYPMLDDTHHTYAVVIVPHQPSRLPTEIVVMARVVEDSVVIEVDTTDKPLVDALTANQNIPREKIILAYAGEMITEISLGN
jgi:hypothetical protein